MFELIIPFSKARYSGAIGDVIVGRIVEVGNKRWKVDINAKQDAVLLLGNWLFFMTHKKKYLFFA